MDQQHEPETWHCMILARQHVECGEGDENRRPQWKDCEKNALLGLRKRASDEDVKQKHAACAAFLPPSGERGALWGCRVAMRVFCCFSPEGFKLAVNLRPSKAENGPRLASDVVSRTLSVGGVSLPVASLSVEAIHHRPLACH